MPYSASQGRRSGQCTTQWAIPARPVLEVAHDVVLARAAQAEGEERCIGLWIKAADTEDTIPYMEPPYWY